MILFCKRLIIPLFILAATALAVSDQFPRIVALLDEELEIARVEQPLFEQLGWSLPDAGDRVKRLAELAPGGAFDPADLEQLDATETGYTASWHVHRFQYYNLDWDITALQLQPLRPVAGMPSIAIINGGSTNWYEFFVDPLNNPGLGQFLAQKVPVILITIPGNYKRGGWSQPNAQRLPSYLLDRHPPESEVKLRNAVFTFSLIAEGVRGLLEKISSGPLLIAGHSTGGELQFMLHNSSLGHRLNGLSLGWGTGPPAFLKRSFDERRGAREDRVEEFRKRALWEIRGRDPEGYVSSGYIGPLNPVSGKSPLEVARGWFGREERRRPNFKQNIQDLEHQGVLELEQKVREELAQTLRDNPYGVDESDVLRDLFAPSRVTLQGYRKMVWVVAGLDAGHWNKNPAEALETYTADQFRQANPGAAIRVLLLDAPITHYGHIEKPAEVAGALFAAARWLVE